MEQKEYIIEGRRFRTQADFKRAQRDQEVIERLRRESADYNLSKLQQLREDLRGGKYQFYTLLGQDFQDELTDRIERAKRQAAAEAEKRKRARESAAKSAAPTKSAAKAPAKSTAPAKPAKTVTQVSEKEILAELKKREKRRKMVVVVSAVVAALCLGYFGLYVYYNRRTGADYENLAALKDKEPIMASNPAPAAAPVIHYTDEAASEAPEVLDEYKNLLIKNKKLIGWIKIDDTNIDYPVMQTDNNEYYLEHNINQEYDKNGSIFMDKDCDVIKPSMNLILYGHHMQSGKMFGKLDKYSDEKYFEKHRYIRFDTIYEKGIYEVMYVFRSRVYSEEDVVFKYYQFIDAMSEVEFDSYMKEMAADSLYDTGVTAKFGDRLLTLSTCDYQEKNGRFVVVAKRVAEKE